MYLVLCSCDIFVPGSAAKCPFEYNKDKNWHQLLDCVSSLFYLSHLSGFTLVLCFCDIFYVLAE